MRLTHSFGWVVCCSPTTVSNNSTPLNPWRPNPGFFSISADTCALPPCFSSLSSFSGLSSLPWAVGLSDQTPNILRTSVQTIGGRTCSSYKTSFLTLRLGSVSELRGTWRVTCSFLSCHLLLCTYTPRNDGRDGVSLDFWFVVNSHWLSWYQTTSNLSMHFWLSKHKNTINTTQSSFMCGWEHMPLAWRLALCITRTECMWRQAKSMIVSVSRL